MTIRDRDTDDWFRRFMGSRRWSPWGTPTGDIFREFEEMRKDMERMFEETIQDIDRVPKELVREYETPSGKVREVGPLVYGYTATIGPDGKPRVREFGNVRPSSLGAAAAPMLSSEIEPLADVMTSDKDVKVTVEMPGVSKQDIKINTYESTVEVSTMENAKRRYRRVIELPPETNTETARSTYTNGILEITFSKKAKPKGKEIKVE